MVASDTFKWLSDLWPRDQGAYLFDPEAQHCKEDFHETGWIGTCASWGMRKSLLGLYLYEVEGLGCYEITTKAYFMMYLEHSKNQIPVLGNAIPVLGN